MRALSLKSSYGLFWMPTSEQRCCTGEDMVEFHCHGGVVCVRRVLEQVLANALFSMAVRT